MNIKGLVRITMTVAAAAGFVLGAGGMGNFMLFAGKAPTCSLGTPVTAAFRNAAGDRIRDDGRGAYTGDLSACEGAFINANDGLTIQLNAGDANDRYMVLDFTDRATTGPHSCAWSFPGNQAAPVQMQLRMNALDDYGNIIGLSAIPAGSTAPAFGKINFVNPVPDGIQWTLRYQSHIGGVSVADLTVTRTSDTVWVLSSTVSDLALLQCTTTSKKPVTNDDGEYVMPFSVTVRK